MAEEETTAEGAIEEPTVEAKPEPTEEYKEIQRTLAKAQDALKQREQELEILKAQQPTREIAEAIAEMSQRIDELVERNEELGKRQEAAEKGEEYKPAPSPKTEARRLRHDADEILADHGFSPLDPRFKEARREANPLRAVNRRIREIHQDEEGKRKADFDKLVEEAVKEKWQQTIKDRAPDLKMEGGGPGGGMGDEQAWLKGFNEGKYDTPADHEKAKKILGNLQGGFK